MACLNEFYPRSDIAREINVSPKDVVVDSDESDEFCPSWLKGHKIQNETFDSKALNDQLLEKPRHKRDLEVDVLGKPVIRDTKKVDSPVKQHFFVDATMTRYQRALVDFIEGEIAYCSQIRLATKVSRTLLQNVGKYLHLFSKDEENLIFDEIYQISELSSNFIKAIVNCLKFSNGFKDFESLQKLKLNHRNEREEHLDYNISRLVYNCDVTRANFGAILNNMVDTLKFKTTIISYFTKNDFRIDLLAQKLKSGGHLMNEWLQEAKIESMDNSLHDLLYMPIQRLIRYPLLIKDLINSLGLRNDSLKHDIHLSLIKVNQLIAKCNNQPSVSTWKELKQFESEKSSFFPSRSLAINDFDQEPLATADDMKLTITGKNSEKVTYGKVEDITKSGNIITRQKGDYTTLIHIFKEKYQNLKNLETGIISLKVTLLNFMKSQLRYSDLWLLFLDEENPETDKRFITSIYSSFSEKLKHQMELTLSIVDKIDKLVIQPLAQALECCDDVRALVKTHRKYRSAYIEYIRYCGANSKQGTISQRKFHKAQTCIKIENSIKEKVPRLLDFQDEFVVAILASLNEFCCNWYFVLIGQRSFDEYNRLLGASYDEEQLSAHQDIVSSYKRTLFLTKLAIMEASDSYPDHAFFFA